jgi:predicted Zn-dependent protease
MYSDGSTFQPQSPLVPNNLVLPNFESERLLLAFQFLIVTVITAAYVLAFVARIQWPSIEALEGKAIHYLESRQYAFALPRLTQLAKLQPYDGDLQLSLARAYIGLDQDTKAWIAIARAKKLGRQVQQDPALTKELARHYLQQNKYNMATEVLKPLANKGNLEIKNILADYVSSRGDYLFLNGGYVEAKSYWVKARELRR